MPSDPPPSYETLALQERLSVPRAAAARRTGSPDLPASSHRPGSGHQRSYSLGVLPPLRPPPPPCRSLPRDLTPVQVRDILRSGRLRPPELAERPLSAQHVRQVLRGGLRLPRSRGDSFEVAGADACDDDTTNPFGGARSDFLFWHCGVVPNCNVFCGP